MRSTEHDFPSAVMGQYNMVILFCDQMGSCPSMESACLNPEQELAAGESPRGRGGLGQHVSIPSQNRPQLWPALPLQSPRTSGLELSESCFAETSHFFYLPITLKNCRSADRW